MGRSVRGMGAPPPVGFRTTEGDAVEAADAFTMLGVGTEGLADARADVVGVEVAAGLAVVDPGVGVVTGRGCDIGVS